MKYRITICNNETGEILLRTECSVIVGGITVEGGSRRFTAAQGSGFGVACAVAEAQKAAKTVLKDLPMVRREMGAARRALRRATVCKEGEENG